MKLLMTYYYPYTPSNGTLDILYNNSLFTIALDSNGSLAYQAKLENIYDGDHAYTIKELSSMHKTNPLPNEYFTYLFMNEYLNKLFTNRYTKLIKYI